MNKYIVLGDPIAHSLSPAIHQQFAKQWGLEIIYHKQQCQADIVVDTIKKLVLDNYQGINLTAPLKIAAMPACDYLSERAKQAGAINNLHIVNNKIYGDNTDGIGLTSALSEHVDLAKQQVLLVGSGGVMRSLVMALLATNAKVWVTARNYHKAAAVTINTNASAIAYAKLATLNFDIVINAVGLRSLDTSFYQHLPLSAALYYDLLYEDNSSFKQWCTIQQVPYVDGLSMLIHERAHAFKIWHGKSPKNLAITTALTKEAP